MNSVFAAAALLVSKLLGLVPCKSAFASFCIVFVSSSKHRCSHAVASLGLHPWGRRASPRANPSIERTSSSKLRLLPAAAHVER
jgi:hypothetical protein